MVYAEQLWLTLLLGLCLGSFTTALVYRLPRGGSVIAQERSACPACGHTLGILDLVPVLSYIFLRGRCRHCKKSIGLQYLLIELCVLGSCLLLFSVFSFSLSLLLLYALAAVCVAIVAIDFEHMIIPDGLNIAVAALLALLVGGLAFEQQRGPDFVTDLATAGALGALLYGGGAFLLRAGGKHFMGRDPLGLGDVKFFAAAGAWLGPDVQLLAWFMILSGILGIVLALGWRKFKGAGEFPFGPALVVAFATILIVMRPGILQYM